MKFCKNKDCKQVNPQTFSNFAPKARYKDGLYSRCRSCQNEASRIKEEKSRALGLIAYIEKHNETNS